MSKLIEDPHFRVEVVNSTPDPNYTCWVAMHQDYSDLPAIDSKLLNRTEEGYNEEWFGNKLIEHCLNHGEWGPAEHPCITFNVINFPHSVSVQLRTHRLITMDVQSGRYCGKRVGALGEYLLTNPIDAAQAIEKVFYFRPSGEYVDREGKKYNYTSDWLAQDIEWCGRGAIKYYQDRIRGKVEEHARFNTAYELRQHFVVTLNLRQLCHILGVRGMKNSQPEIQVASRMMLDKFIEWNPTVGNWFEKKHYTKNRLAP